MYVLFDKFNNTGMGKDSTKYEHNYISNIHSLRNIRNAFYGFII